MENGTKELCGAKQFPLLAPRGPPPIVFFLFSSLFSFLWTIWFSLVYWFSQGLDSVLFLGSPIQNHRSCLINANPDLGPCVQPACTQAIVTEVWSNKRTLLKRGVRNSPYVISPYSTRTIGGILYFAFCILSSVFCIIICFCPTFCNTSGEACHGNGGVEPQPANAPSLPSTTPRYLLPPKTILKTMLRTNLS